MCSKLCNMLLVKVNWFLLTVFIQSVEISVNIIRQYKNVVKYSFLPWATGADSFIIRMSKYGAVGWTGGGEPGGG